MNEQGYRARPLGRALRLIVGVALVAQAGLPLVGASRADVLTATGVVLAGIAFYTVVQVMISRYFVSVNAWLGAFLAIVPVAGVFVMSEVPGQLGTLLFVGISLLVAAARSDGGCEVMTLPAILLGRRTHLVCIAFSPIDWLERKLASSRSTA